MTPEELKTFCENLNGGATIDSTLLAQLLNQGRTILFSERNWMFLRKVNTSISVTANSNSWNTSIDISGISDFLRFYRDEKGYSIKLFDGDKKIEYYRQVPFSKRLEYKDIPNTFSHDIVNKVIYINGNIPFSGTLWINYIYNPTTIDITVTTNMETNGMLPFPSVYHGIIGYYAIGINKGAIDYDEINRQMLPTNQATLNLLKTGLQKHDTEMQLAEEMQTDPANDDIGEFRNGAIPLQRL